MIQPRRRLIRTGAIVAGLGAALGIALTVQTPASLTSSTSVVRAEPQASPGPYVTLLFSRTPLANADGQCRLDERQVARLDTVVAPYLAQRGMRPTGSLQTRLVKQSSRVCTHAEQTALASWEDALALQRRYGWRFVSHSASYPLSWAGLSASQKRAETCGSAQTIRSKGLKGAEGMFAWPHNYYSVVDQETYVAPCFAYGRRYAGGGLTTIQFANSHPFWQNTTVTEGGACNDPALACYRIETVGNPGGRYDVPQNFIKRISALQPGQWYTLQSYVLVTGKSPAFSTNPQRWDCTSPDPRQHWTTDYERYCWNDYQQIIKAIGKGTTVTDPLTVARAFGRPNLPPGTVSP